MPTIVFTHPRRETAGIRDLFSFIPFLSSSSSHWHITSEKPIRFEDDFQSTVSARLPLTCILIVVLFHSPRCSQDTTRRRSTKKTLALFPAHVLTLQTAELNYSMRPVSSVLASLTSTGPVSWLNTVHQRYISVFLTPLLLFSTLVSEINQSVLFVFVR